MNPLMHGFGRTVVACHDGWSRISSKLFSFGVQGAFAAFGPHSIIETPLRLRGAASVAIGRGVFVGSGSWLEVLEPRPGSIRIRIGDRTRFAGQVVISSAESVEIGRGVLFARNVYISDHSHRFSSPNTAIVDQGVDHVAPVRVDDGAWVSQNVVILPGVHIGQGAVVGANSVVAQDVPARSVAVGAPARIVRRLDGDDQPSGDGPTLESQPSVG